MPNAEEEHSHDHSYVEVCRTQNVLVVEEAAHQVLTIQLHDRGFALELTREEANDLAAVFAEIQKYIKESSPA